MKIKVCGITDADQMKELDAMGVDYAGMIFYDKSPRYVLPMLRSKTLLAQQLLLQKVGVFVNETENNILDQVENYELNLVQLHGKETPELCRSLGRKVPVIKVFSVNNETRNIDWMVAPYKQACNYFLFDYAAKDLYGGSGKQFEWKMLNDAVIGKEFFLSGGIAPGDADLLKAFSHPFFYGVDINSKFEISPGVKNLSLVREFVQAIKTNAEPI